MIDIHSHILHGIDDGADSLRESIELCKIAYENNIDTIVATPHFYFNMPVDEFLGLRDSRIGELRSKLEQLKLPVEILPGAEVFATEEMTRSSSEDLRKLTVCNTNYILTEFPFEGLTHGNFWSLIDLFFKYSLCPIIAHPERYDIFQRDHRLGVETARKGLPLQVNITSPAGLLGAAAKQCAERLMLLDTVSFLATDAHNPRYRSTDITDIYNTLAARMPSTKIYNLMEDNPRALLDNKVILTRHYGKKY